MQNAYYCGSLTASWLAGSYSPDLSVKLRPPRNDLHPTSKHFGASQMQISNKIPLSPVYL